jgi:hypothetical protein
VGFDPLKCLTKIDKDGNVEDTIGVEVKVLDPVLHEHPLEEVVCR